MKKTVFFVLVILLLSSAMLAVFTGCEHSDAGVRMPARITRRDVAYEITYDGNTMTLMGEDGTKIVAECTPDGTHQKAVIYDAEGNVTDYAETAYEYDADGNVIKETSYDEAGNVSLYREYDGERLLKEVTYSDGVPRQTEEYSYDADGRMVSDRTLASDGSLLFDTTYEYDAQGRMVKGINLFGNGEVLSGVENIYDENGYLIECVSKIGETIQTKYTYDENGNKASAFQQNTVGDFRGHTGWEYDAHNNVTKEIFYASDGSIRELWEYVYQYDGNGNKTEAVCYHTTADTPRDVYYRRSFAYDENNALGQGEMIKTVTDYTGFWSIGGEFLSYVQEYVFDAEGYYAKRWKEIRQYDDGRTETVFEITETCTVPLTDAQYAAFEGIFLSASVDVEASDALLPLDHAMQ